MVEGRMEGKGEMIIGVEKVSYNQMATGASSSPSLSFPSQYTAFDLKGT